jgi:hypothetical protein
VRDRRLRAPSGIAAEPTAQLDSGNIAVSDLAHTLVMVDVPSTYRTTFDATHEPVATSDGLVIPSAHDPAGVAARQRAPRRLARAPRRQAMAGALTRSWWLLLAPLAAGANEAPPAVPPFVAVAAVSATSFLPNKKEPERYAPWQALASVQDGPPRDEPGPETYSKMWCEGGRTRASARCSA